MYVLTEDYNVHAFSSLQFLDRLNLKQDYKKLKHTSIYSDNYYTCKDKAPFIPSFDGHYVPKWSRLHWNLCQPFSYIIFLIRHFKHMANNSSFFLILIRFNLDNYSMWMTMDFVIVVFFKN